MRTTRRVVVVDRVAVPYLFAGREEREPIVLVHGLAGSTHWWRRNVPTLAAEYALYLVDLPGFGTMHRHRRRFAVAHGADWIARWMDAVGLTSAHFVAHSMGGLICLRLAADYPYAVRRLALFAPAGTQPMTSVAKALFPLLLTVRHARPSFLPILAYDAARAGPSMLLRAGRETLAQNLVGDLSRIQSPVLLLWGEHDPLVSVLGGAVMCAALKDARLLQLPGAGHIAMYDRADLCNPLLLRFLAGHDVAGACLS